jgi:hypothetical protein
MRIQHLREMESADRASTHFDIGFENEMRISYEIVSFRESYIIYNCELLKCEEWPERRMLLLSCRF